MKLINILEDNLRDVPHLYQQIAGDVAKGFEDIDMETDGSDDENLQDENLTTQSNTANKSMLKKRCHN